MSKKFLTMACCAVLTAFFSLSAQAIEVKGQVSYPYKGKIFSSKPSDKDKMEAIKQAKLAALKKFSTGFSISEQKLYAGMESDVQANLDKYISNYRVVAEEVDTNLKTLNLVVRVNINDSLLLSEMHKNSPQQPAVQGDGSLFASLFVAREISESKIFDERRTTITQKSSAASTTREASAGSVNESAQTTEKATTGGNTIRKSAVNKYRELATTDFNAAFSTVLTQLGFEATEYADVHENCGGPKPEALKAAFMKGDEIPSKLRNQAIRAARSCDVRYFATGYMNVSAPQKDSVSGKIKVMVAVNGMVWDISKKLPRKVGSVGPVQAFGLADDQDSARREALRHAASAAGQAIANQLASKSIR